MDINFFEAIKKKKKKANLSGILMFAVISIALTLMILLYTSKKMEYISLENEMNQMNAIMTNPDFQEQLNSVSLKEARLEEIQKSYSCLLRLSAVIFEYHTVREEIIKTLAGELTKSLYFGVVTITEKQMTIEGYGTDVLDIAQFEYNLNHCGLFENIAVNTLEEEFATYIFIGSQIEEVVYNYKFNVQLTISGGWILGGDIRNSDITDDKDQEGI